MTQQSPVGLSKALEKDGGITVETAPLQAEAVAAPEFVIEINQTVVVSKIDSLVQAWCVDCIAEGQWITPEHAAIISNTDTRSLYRRIEVGEVHFIESTDGPALVCLNSLFG